MSKSFVRLLTAVMGLFLLVSCDLIGGSGGSAADYLPDLAGYNTIEGESFTDALTSLGVMATLAGQPELGAPIAAVSGTVACYQEAGAISARVYSQEAEPINSGVIAVGDRDALLNPLTFLQCVPGTDGRPGPSSVGIEPCSHSYTLTKEGNEFYILYAGLTPEVCQTFCSSLEGCTGH